jgi:WS/DGAT/MGAT family acyltransferase
MERRRMPGIDAAWLRMDRPNNLMVVTGLFFFARPVAADDLRQLFRERLLRYRRFRERVLPGRLGARYELLDDVDLGYHVVEERLADPGDKAVMEAYVSDLLSERLDPSQPLWRFHVVQNCVGGTAVVARLHHCVADGIALMQVVLSMTERPDGAAPPVPHAAPEVKGLVTRVLLGLDSVVSLVRMTFRSRDPRTVLKGPLSVRKRAAWTPVLSLEQVRRTKDGLGATINDVLLTAVASALRRYLLERGDAIDRLDLRAAIPVNLRSEKDMGKLGNQFGLIFVALPVGIDDPRKRLEVLQRRLLALKRSTEPYVVLGILRLMGWLPRAVQRLIVRIFGSKITAVMSNVPGPRERLLMAGHEVESMLFWVPQSGDAGLGVSIFSYAGTVRVGIATDEGLCPDPGRILEHFEAELGELARLAGES